MSLFSTDRILVPIDFSDGAFTALSQAIDFVGDPARVYALHVLQPLEPTDPAVIWQTLDDQTRKQHVEKAFFERCSDAKYQGLHFDVAIGNPSSEIVDYAKQHNIDLIVVSPHGRTGPLGRFLLGSVAERVVRHAHCPVLVVRR
ncbi:universal stress protein [Thermocoleostomius sinensis]|jgi:nucleotide-binding universal stress UspA family protein|uniref:Universal stress protein n=1 Tax=Thermocoleostomius sinensis A174 TaxID=2016057 RepID=A0A9E8ZGM3_9CYAN|nr:universal stress protein [Thermocoleostomius sinensis]WAL62391.1 universal stress protein [Thermocoleostomius sinensis A174]